MNCHFESCFFKTDKNKIKTWTEFDLLEMWSNTTGSTVTGFAKKFTLFGLYTKKLRDNDWQPSRVKGGILWSAKSTKKSRKKVWIYLNASKYEIL